MELIDLSRVIYDGMPKIPILPDVHVRKFFDLDKGHPLNVTEVSLPCHAGTHVDAPIHIVPNGKSIEELPLDAFVGNGATISVKKSGGEEITAADLENSGVPVNKGDILMLHTGWDAKFESCGLQHASLFFRGRRGVDGQEGDQDGLHRLYHGGFADTASSQRLCISGSQDAPRQRSANRREPGEHRQHRWQEDPDHGVAAAR